MNEPLMHAMIALAARCAERDPAPTLLEAQDIARGLVEAYGLDTLAAEALHRAAENLVAPFEASSDDQLEDLPDLPEHELDHDASGLAEPSECRLDGPALSPEAALFDAAESFAKIMDELIQDLDGRHTTAERFPDWSFVAFIEHPTDDGGATQPRPRYEWSCSGKLPRPHDGTWVRDCVVASQHKQKLLRSCDFYTCSDVILNRVLAHEALLEFFRLLEADHSGSLRGAPPGALLQLAAPSPFLSPSNVSLHGAGRGWPHLRESMAWRRCTQTLFFFELGREQRSWPTKIDWNIDAMSTGLTRCKLEVHEDSSEEAGDQLLVTLLRRLAK